MKGLHVEWDLVVLTAAPAIVFQQSNLGGRRRGSYGWWWWCQGTGNNMYGRSGNSIKSALHPRHDSRVYRGPLHPTHARTAPLLGYFRFNKIGTVVVAKYNIVHEYI